MKDPITLLEQDHRAVEALFRRFENSRGAEKQKIGQQIIAELSVHATVEEQLVYPLLREQDEEAALKALEEHHAVKLLLDELDDMRVTDERYDAKMRVVQESVEMHVEEEEGKLLPRIDRKLKAPEREQLAERIVKLKQAAPDLPHPAAPDQPPIGLVGGMVAKMLDTGKTLVRSVTSREKAEGQARAKRRGQAQTRRASTRRKAPTARRKSAARRRRRTTTRRSR